MYALQMLALMRAEELEREARARRQRQDWADAQAAGKRHGLRDRLNSRAGMRDVLSDTAWLRGAAWLRDTARLAYPAPRPRLTAARP